MADQGKEFVRYGLMNKKRFKGVANPRSLNLGIQSELHGHIKIGKEFPEISQLLLYSFGLQDQEFIVVYEMEDLIQFSDLVYSLRDTDARRYTSRDTPLTTAMYHPVEKTLSLWE